MAVSSDLRDETASFRFSFHVRLYEAFVLLYRGSVDVSVPG